MTAAPPGGHGALPTLAYVHRPGSFDALALADAARGTCRLLWVVDTSLPGVTATVRLLERLGDVLDVEGTTPEGAAAALSARAPDGILALADDALCWTAEVAGTLGLAFHSTRCAAALTDKRLQRAALRAGGLVVPASAEAPAAPDDATLARLAREVGFPAVVKPARGEGSRDTCVVATRDDLGAALAAARRSGAQPVLVLEQFIPDASSELGGHGFAGYLSVESAVQGGVACHLATNGRTPLAHPLRETGFFVPSALDGELLDRTLGVVTQAIAALGVTVGVLHTEVKLTDDGPVVIEVNGRVGGGVPELLERACHARVLELAMRLALGQALGCDGLLATSGVAYLLYVHAPAVIGVIAAVEGVAELRSVPGVDEVVLRRVPGDRVDWREGNHGHVLSVLGTAPDHDALRAVLALVESTVRIEVTP